MESGSISNAHLYRLNSIEKIISEHESVKKVREKLVKKYKKWSSIFYCIDKACACLALACTATTIAILTTIIGAPIAISVQSVGLGFGFGSLLSKYLKRRVNIKLKKHKKILELCQTLINNIHEVTSSAINDGYVSDEQYKTVLDLLDNYYKLRRTVSQEVNSELSKHEESASSWLAGNQKNILENLHKMIKKKT